MNVIDFYSDAIQNNERFTLSDPCARPFTVLAQQKARLEEARRATLSHIWAREAHGKVEIVPLDDEFRQLQVEISSLEPKIKANQEVTEALARTFERYEILEPMLIKIDEERRNIAHELEELKRQQYVEARPIYDAAATLGVPIENNPKLQEIAAKYEALAKPLKERAATLDKWITAINQVLAGVVR